MRVLDETLGDSASPLRLPLQNHSSKPRGPYAGGLVQSTR
jgi:hypothetical protein